VRLARSVPAALLPTLFLSLLLAACSTENADREAARSEASGPETPGRRPVTVEAATAALVEHGPAGAGELPGGRFRFGHLIPGGDAGVGGRVATGSWDLYWTRDDGDRGAWGVGIDVFDSAGDAATAVEEEGAFWCPTHRREVPGIETAGLDALVAVSCRRLGGEGYYATLDASQGPVTSNITVAWPTRAEAEAALVAVWPPVRDAAAGVEGNLS